MTRRNCIACGRYLSDEEQKTNDGFCHEHSLVGKRIKLTEMFDPDPLPVGTEGRVTFVQRVPTMGFTQIGVAWDNGRTLLLACPPDKYEVVE